jgi:hypothetical protein
VGTSDSTTVSDDPSSSYICELCVGCFLRGVPRGGRYAPPGYAQHPEIFSGAILLFLAVF